MPAQASDADGKRIARIRFDPPLQPLAANELLALVALTPGEPLDPDRVRLSIENLYATGRFDDIAVDAEVQDNEVTLTFQTVNRWFVGRQEIEGVRNPPSAAQLLNGSKLSLGGEYSEAALRQAVDNMLNLARANGLYRAEVETEVEREPETESVRIRYILKAGQRARFGDPVVRGRTSRTVSQVTDDSGWRRSWPRSGFRVVTETRVQSGLQRIRRALEKSNLLMARVALAGMEWRPAENTAIPTLEIFDGPSVRVLLRGERLSAGRQRDLLPIFQERNVDRELLNEGSRNLAFHLQSQGYFDARASYTSIDDGPERVIEYQIDKGPRYRLAKLEIEGNNYFDDETIRERMSILPATLIRYRQGRFSDRLLESDSAAIRDLYVSNGFLDARIDSRIETGIGRRDRQQDLLITVTEGPQFLIESLTVKGVDAEMGDYVRSLMQSAEGQPYSERTLGIDREAVLTALFNRGYDEAEFTWTAQRAGGSAIAIEITILLGRRETVRQVIVTGLKATDPRLVYSRIDLKPGDELSLGRILESQTRLYDLGIFARVDTAIQNAAGREDSKFVLFDVDEARKYSFNVGIGAQVGRIGTGSIRNFDSPGGATGFSPRLNAGITRNNLFGIGHSATMQGRVSNLQERLQLTYLAPHFRDRDSLSLAISGLYDNSRDVRTFAAERLEAAIQLTQRLSRANTFQARYAVRQVTVDPDSLKIEPLLIPLLAQPVRLGLFAATFIQDRRDDPIDSRKGFYNSADAAVALNAFGSQSNFLRLIARNSSYHGISRDLIFGRSVTFGLQDRIRGGPLEDVPLPERFFSGGASSHRGFPENQAGPRDLTTGFPIGGKALLMFNHELRYPLIGDSLGAVLFHDMGNVYSRIGRLSLRYRQQNVQDFDYMVQSVGIGFRYRTPIGPIRLDLAFSPNSPRFIGFEGTQEELLFGQGRQTLQRINQFQFHFSLGQAF
jgi:outer membrane protein insertion porin family